MFMVSKKKFEALEQDLRDLELETIASLMALEGKIRDMKSIMKQRGIWK